ncbi:MAG: hypothetical protein QM764_23860 [Chitinophagaceae bacterium]
MEIKIVNHPFDFKLSGYSGVALNKDFQATAFRLMDRMWQAVKSNQLKNKGINIWVYEEGNKVFAGVELDNTQTKNQTDLEHKHVLISHYARYKHIGAYHLLKQVGERMRNELLAKGYIIRYPYIEIYGHWTSDESKLETDLIMCLE